MMMPEHRSYWIHKGLCGTLSIAYHDQPGYGKREIARASCVPGREWWVDISDPVRVEIGLPPDEGGLLMANGAAAHDLLDIIARLYVKDTP
jgi:hypothetical protein